MSDKIHNKTTDKGWAAMRAMLDKEMPIQKRKRRAIWWWLLLLLPVLSWGGWSLWQTEHAPKAPLNPELKTQPAPGLMAQKAQNTTVPDDFKNTQTTQRTAQKATTDTKSHRSNILPTSAPKGGVNLLTGTQNTTYNHANGAETAVEKPGIISKTDSHDLTLSGTDVQEMNSTTETLTALPGTGEQEQNSATETLATLPGRLTAIEAIPAVLPEINVVPVITAPTPTKKAPAPRAWKFGATCAASTEKFKGANGLSAGLALQWQPTKRWGLRTGLSLTRYTPQLSSQPVVSVASSQYADAVSNEFILEDPYGNITYPATAVALAESVVIPVSHYKMLETPVLVTWNAFKSVKIFAGISNNYIIATNASNNGFSGALQLTAADSTAAKRLNNLAFQSINRWSVRIQTGIGINIGRHFELMGAIKFPFGLTAQNQTLKTDNYINPLTADTNNTVNFNSNILSLSIAGTYWF